jgi:signal transduction histidine kinase
MNKKVFSIKTFIGITCILLAVVLLVFGFLRFFLPRVYEHELKSRVKTDTVDFVKELSTLPRAEWYGKIEKFCYSNNINASVYKEDGSHASTKGIQLSALTEYKMKHNSFDYASAVEIYFVEREGITRIISFYYNPELIEQIEDTFDTMFPTLIIVILLVSMAIAFLYTRFVMKNRNLQIAIEDERRRREFFSALSHELKTPVTILKGELDGMILNVGKFKDRDKYLQEAYETTQSIEELTKEITAAAKLSIVKPVPEEINLSDITHDCLSKINELIEKKNIKVKQDLSDIPISADKKLMGIVISNIIGNAVKHSPPGADIDIHFDETLKFSVQNRGTHSGEKSSDSDLSGGLGLYIVKTILDMHGFKHSFENTEDKTLFTIIFTRRL